MHIQALSVEDQAAIVHGDELLAEITDAVSTAGVDVVNLLPVFREATAEGRRLYWRDDTHWNDEGIRLGAEEVGRVMEAVLP